MKWRHAEEAKRKRDESQQNDDHHRKDADGSNMEVVSNQAVQVPANEGDESDSDIEVTDSPNDL